MSINLENNIAIIVLNYCNYKLTEMCINNLIEINIKSHIVVVDNNSPNESFDYLHDRFSKNKNVSVIKNKINNGYADGNNFGAKYILNKEKDIKFICIMNPDVIISYKELFNNLANKIINEEDVALIGAMMIWNNVLDLKNVYWSIPTKKAILKEHLIFYNKKNTTKGEGIISDKEGIAFVEVLPGSFFMIKSGVLKKIGFLDTGTFLYNEENILAIKLKEIGLREVISINDYYFHNHTPSLKQKSLKEKLNSNNIVFNSRKYLCENYYNDKNLNFMLKLVNKINIMYIYFTYIPSKIKSRLSNSN